jgi:Icc-related predicted phosphoesterase
MMKLLCVTDLHGKVSALQKIFAQAGEADVLLLGGDITEFGTPNSAESLVRRAERAYPRVLAVAGNCDSAAIDQRLVKLGVGLFRRGVIHAGVGFIGLSAMPPWTGRMYELSEEEIADALETGREQVRTVGRHVVLSHCPPWGTDLDLTSGGQHVGSRSLWAFIEQYQPPLVICGHIHEGRGVEEIGATTVVNCGPAFRGDYAVVHLDDDVRVDLRSRGDR